MEVYVYKLQDFEKAEAYVHCTPVGTQSNVSSYCNQIHLTQSSPESSPINSRRASTSEPDDPLPSIYHTLLSLYLTPPTPHEPNWPPAMALLSRHGSRLPASSTLNIIPSKLPVADLESYFQGRIRAANSILNEARVVAGLRASEVVRAQAALLLGDTPGSPGGRNRRVVVSDERVCGVCHKRFGRSVVAVMPDNAVVHYACLSRAAAQRNPESAGGVEPLARRTPAWSS